MGIAKTRRFDLRIFHGLIDPRIVKGEGDQREPASDGR
jgi:hypothetical protein